MSDSAAAKHIAPAVKAQLLADKYPDLQQMIRALSLSRFAAIARQEDSRASDHAETDAYVYASHQAMILIASKDFKVTFKAHFNVSEVPITSLIAAAKGDQERLEDITYDFFREFTNLTAGAIKQQLHSSGIGCGISLPIVTSGYDEMIFSDVLRRDRLHDYWKITSSKVDFTCTAHIDMFETEQLAAYRFNGDDSNDQQGSMEFL